MSLGGFAQDNENGYCLVHHVKTQKGKTILHRMALDFPVNAVTAIMGPSGAGAYYSVWMSLLWCLCVCMTAAAHALSCVASASLTVMTVCVYLLFLQEKRHSCQF